MHRVTRFLLCLAAAASLASGAASGQTKLLRFPDIHQDNVVFTYAGDLWTAPSSGGTGRGHQLLWSDDRRRPDPRGQDIVNPKIFGGHINPPFRY